MTFNNKNNKLRIVDLVIIDDQKVFVDALAAYFQMKGKNLVIDKYYHPLEFLEKVASYPTYTRISIDYDFKGGMNRIDLAKQLHTAGYVNLFLVSGMIKIVEKIPDYLIVISKEHIEDFHQLIT